MANRKVRKLRIVCLGGGIGTSVLIHGLKNYGFHITVITSMADDGGSSGRLRKAYNIMPPGDMVSCIAALVEDKNKELSSLLTYRFPGTSRENKAIDGHKLGNLIMLAEMLRTKDVYKALEVTKQILGVDADILPASDVRTRLGGITKDGRRIYGENALNIPRHAEPYGLKKIFIAPKDPAVNRKVIESLNKADVIISGPGDLYTNQLPVLVIPKIKQILLKKKSKKIFIINVANKPFETKNFSLSDFINTMTAHLGVFPFDTVIANNNMSVLIPKKHNKYKYVELDKQEYNPALKYKIVRRDLINKDFPIYHDSKKLAKTVVENI